jgi:tetraacyldisaccharide 4'-kinase
MDDGLQNPAVAKDLSIALVDGRRGIGNGEVIPAGPLRAPLDFQIGLVDAIVVRDPPSTTYPGSVHAVLRDGFPGPVLAANIAPAGDTSWIPTQPLVAFAGIANPQRFFELLQRLGGKLIECVSFADHHAFTQADAERLVALAQNAGAQLVTTEKDFARMAGDAALARLAAQTRVLPIELTFDDRDLGRLGSLIESALKRTSRQNRPPPQR